MSVVKGMPWRPCNGCIDIFSTEKLQREELIVSRLGQSCAIVRQPALACGYRGACLICRKR